MIELHLATGEAAPLGLCPGQTYNLTVSERTVPSTYYLKNLTCNRILTTYAAIFLPTYKLPVLTSYHIASQVSFGEPREALVTASSGVMSRAQPGDVLQW